MSLMALAAVLSDLSERVTSGSRGRGPLALMAVGTATGLAATAEVGFAGAGFGEGMTCVTAAAFGAVLKLVGAGFDDDVAAAAAAVA